VAQNYERHESALEKLQQACHLPQDVQTVAIMINWFSRLRSCISNIGKQTAIREKRKPPMEDIHTDDEMPMSYAPAKTTTKPPAKTQSVVQSSAHNIPTQAVTASILPMDQSNINTLANSSRGTDSASTKRTITITTYTAAPPETPVYAQYISTWGRAGIEATLNRIEQKQGNLLKYTDKLITADKKLEESASLFTKTRKTCLPQDQKQKRLTKP
jgi:hypothetical protein